MARRNTKSLRHTGDTQSAPVNGKDQTDGRPPASANAAPGRSCTQVPDIRSRIEQVAYQLYLDRGCRHGEDVRDWLEAERLIIGASES